VVRCCVIPGREGEGRGTHHSRIEGGLPAMRSGEPGVRTDTRSAPPGCAGTILGVVAVWAPGRQGRTGPRFPVSGRRNAGDRAAAG
jgi:hypothetical protein